MTEMTFLELSRFKCDVDHTADHKADGTLETCEFFVTDARRILALARRALEQGKNGTPLCKRCLHPCASHTDGCPSEESHWLRKLRDEQGDLRALEQPVPTGEVTREHREAAVGHLYAPHGPNEWLSRWIATGNDEGETFPALRLAQLLATREQAAYQRALRDTLHAGLSRLGHSEERRSYDEQAEWLLQQTNARQEIAWALKAEHDNGKRLGRQEAQGGWVAVAQDAYDSLTDGDAEGAIRTLRAALPPPPSDTGKGGE